LVSLAAKSDRIVAAGTQCRSSSGLREAVAWIQAGNLGKIIRARGLCYKRRASIGKTEGPQPIPPFVNYDLWCGPAPRDPLRRMKLHYDWHWVWPTGNGDLGNQGVHQVDIARWVLGESGLAPRTFSFGGRVGYVDDGATPNTLVAFHDYPSAPLIFEVRGLPEKAGTETMDQYKGASIGVVIDCEHGYVVIPSYTRADVFDNDGTRFKRFDGKITHYENFIDAVRTRRSQDLNANITEGHTSAGLCHIANASYRVGRQTPPDQMREELKGNADAQECLGRMREHLAANNVDLARTPVVMGALLQIDPYTERFSNSHKANKYYRREYRKPFVLRPV
jgi:predicted dehydrogenase